MPTRSRSFKCLAGLLLSAGVSGPALWAQPAPEPTPPRAPAKAVPGTPVQGTPTLKLKWNQARPLPVGVFDSAGSLVGPGRFVVTGGFWQAGLASDNIQVYDIFKDQWHVPGKLKLARFNHVQITLDDTHVLVVGGQETKQVGKGIPVFKPELIDVVQGTSQELPEPDLAKPLRAPVACMMGRVAVVVGAGYAYRYDTDKKQWLAPIALHESRAACACVPLDDHRLLVIAGEGRDSLELLDLSAGQSTLLKARMPGPTDDLQALLLPDARVWVLGGQDSKTGDTTDKTWFFKPDAPDARLEPGPALNIAKGVADHRLAAYGSRVYCIGGESQRAGTDTELPLVRALDVRNQTVLSATPLPQPCDDTLVFEFQGRVYVVGGYFMGPATFGGVRLPRASSDVFWSQVPEE